jgi:hypothetical protein
LHQLEWWIHSFQLCNFGGISEKMVKSEKDEKSIFFGRKLAVGDSGEEKYFLFLIAHKILSFEKKLEFETFFCVEFAMLFDFFREPKNEISQLAVQTRKVV